METAKLHFSPCIRVKVRKQFLEGKSNFFRFYDRFCFYMRRKMLSDSKIQCFGRKNIISRTMNICDPKIESISPLYVWTKWSNFGGGVKVFLEIFFWKKYAENAQNQLFSAISVQYTYIGKITKPKFYSLFCMDFVFKDPLRAFNCKIKWINHFLRIVIFGIRETKTGPRSWNVS